MLRQFQQILRLRCLHRVGAGLCLCLVLAVAGCSYSGPVHYYTLRQLHIPHLQWLPALSRIPQAGGTRGGIIYGLTTFQRPGNSATQVIVNLNDGLQVIGTDGSGHHLLNMGEFCLSAAAVTTDGNWIACVSVPVGGNGNSRLQLAALHSTGTSQAHQIAMSMAAFNGSSAGYLAWSPDGQYLAVVRADADDGPGCSVAIFSSPSPHTSFTLAVNLISSQFNDENGVCGVYNLLWTIDGQRLFVLGDAGEATFVATIPVTTLLHTFGSLEVPSNQIETFTFANVYLDDLQIFMDPQRNSLFYTAGTPEQLISFNLHTHQSSVLFTLPSEYHIRAVTWMPNGRQFLIAVGDEPCVDCGQYAVSDVYLYSPDA